MKLLTKTLMAAGLLASCAAWGDNCTSDDDYLPNPQYARTLIISRNQVSKAPTIDVPDHALMKSYGLGYTQDDVNTLHSRVMADILLKYGFDFTNVPVNGEGAQEIEGVAELYPSVYGDDNQFSFILDTANPKRLQNTWKYIEFGYILVLEQDGKDLAGRPYQAGDGYNYAWGNLLELGTDYSITDGHRETFTSISTATFKHVPDQHGGVGEPQYQILLDYYDSAWKKGFYSLTTIYQWVNGVKFVQVHSVITWPCVPSQ